MARALAALAGIAALLIALVTFTGASAAMASPNTAYRYFGAFKTEQLCEAAGEGYGDPFFCTDVPTHSPPWELYVDTPP